MHVCAVRGGGGGGASIKSPCCMMHSSQSHQQDCFEGYTKPPGTHTQAAGCALCPLPTLSDPSASPLTCSSNSKSASICCMTGLTLLLVPSTAPAWPPAAAPCSNKSTRSPVQSSDRMNDQCLKIHAA
jgi:hypothetical protein